MKKIFLVVITVVAFAFCGYSQVNSNAIGARFVGNSDIFGAELSYQHGFGEANRLELDLGWGSNSHHNRINLAGIYHWDWNITEGLNWYVGPGLALGMYSFDYIDKTYLNLGIGGQLGLEYDFKTLGVPLLISIDGRPMWDINDCDEYNGFGWGAAFSIRYIF